MPRLVDEAVVRKTIRVRVPAERAFSVFVEHMGSWWPPAHHIGTEPFQAIVVEPQVGGRWFERDRQGKECFWGQVLAWNPPHLVTLSWHLGPDWKFNPDLAKASEVEVSFIAEGPSTTLVQLVHSKLERHGEGYEQMRTLLDGPDAWTLTLAAFAQEADRTSTT